MNRLDWPRSLVARLRIVAVAADTGAMELVPMGSEAFARPLSVVETVAARPEPAVAVHLSRHLLILAFDSNSDWPRRKTQFPHRFCRSPEPWAVLVSDRR